MLYYTAAVRAAALLSVLLTVDTVSCLSLSSTGMTVMMNSIPYYVPASPLTILPVSFTSYNDLAVVSGMLPLTVMQTQSLDFTTDELETLVDEFVSSDDVFQEGFLQAVVVEYTGSLKTSAKYSFKTSVSQSTLSEYGVKAFATSGNGTSGSIPNGPYFLSLSTGNLYMAYRLYSDVQQAFTEGLVESSSGRYEVLSAAVPGKASGTIGVPSRLYYTPTAEKPLAGVRLTVKDIYDIAGTKTGMGNRAIYELYPEKNVTAPAVQNLIDAGAVVVSKFKTSQFANGEVATADWVDYHSPFNPRGDGYEDPSSSSSGGGAALAAYPWIDLALGSDTGGSVRGPSQVQGLYGNRPTHGLVSLDNAMPLASALDTAGLLTRDPFIWTAAANALYGGLPNNHTSLPTSIKTINFPTNDSAPADALILSFLTNLTTYLNITTTTTPPEPIILEKIWATTKPLSVPQSLNLSTLLNITYPILISQDQTRQLRSTFYTDYAAANNGRLPFVDPVPLTRWAFGDSYPTSTLDEALANKTIFQSWMDEHVLLPSEDSCTDSLLLYVGSKGNASTTVRNVYLEPPSIPAGFSTSRISVFQSGPDHVIPLGETAYVSGVTGKTEYLPVTVDMVAARGCDAVIFEIVEGMVREGLLGLGVVGTGRSVWGGEEILM